MIPLPVPLGRWNGEIQPRGLPLMCHGYAQRPLNRAPIPTYRKPSCAQITIFLLDLVDGRKAKSTRAAEVSTLSVSLAP